VFASSRQCRANCRYSSCLITGFISPIRKRVCLDKSGTRDAFPGTWEVALEEPGNFKYWGPAALPAAACQ
jgi:hypothetical protein